MAVGRAGSYPDYSSGSTNKYIKQLYSSKLLRNFYKYNVIPKITNSEAENQTEIKKVGDKAIFRGTPELTINNYYKGKALTYETPEDAAIELDIDKAKDWAIQIDDIDKFQSDIPLMSKFAEEGGKRMASTICTEFLADIYDDVNTSNYGTSAGAVSGNINLGVSGTPRVLTKDNVIYFFNDMCQVLDEQDTPMDKRHVTVPPAIMNLIYSSDLKNAMFAGTGKSVLLTGESIGKIANFDIHVTNCVNSQTDGGTAFDIFANHEIACAFCTQIAKTEIISQLPNTFGSGMRGLTVYGYKLLYPKQALWGYVRVAV